MLQNLTLRERIELLDPVSAIYLTEGDINGKKINKDHNPFCEK